MEDVCGTPVKNNTHLHIYINTLKYVYSTLHVVTCREYYATYTLMIMPFTKLVQQRGNKSHLFYISAKKLNYLENEKYFSKTTN